METERRKKETEKHAKRFPSLCALEVSETKRRERVRNTHGSVEGMVEQHRLLLVISKSGNDVTLSRGSFQASTHHILLGVFQFLAVTNQKGRKSGQLQLTRTSIPRNAQIALNTSTERVCVRLKNNRERYREQRKRKGERHLVSSSIRIPRRQQ